MAICTLVVAGVQLRRDTAPVRTAAAAVAQTPSWTIEASSFEIDAPTKPPGVPRRAAVAPPSPWAAQEVVTPELVRTASRSPCPWGSGVEVDVRAFGARGDGLADDSRAIQKAIDNVYARGGGRVVFSPGVYRAINVQQDSCIELAGTGGATLVHPDGTSPDSVIEGRVRSTSAAIDRNSRVLRVASAKGMRAGAVVAAQAADGPSSIQRTRLASDVTPYMDQLQLVTTKGLQAAWENFVYVGGELVSYRGIKGNTLLNVKRGRLGTKQAMHRAGTVVAQANAMYAIVLRVAGDRVVLDRRAKYSVAGGNVSVGSVSMSVTGLVIDGNRRPKGSPETNPFPLDYRLARWVSVTGSTMRHGDHGGISFDMGTRDSKIEGNRFSENGDPTHKLGAGVWLFRGAAHNVVRNNTISGRTFVGVMIDDRTEHSTEYDADARQNTIEANTIDIPEFGDSAWNACIVISGSSNTRIVNNVLSNAETGIMVGQVAQGTLPGPTYGNRASGNTIIGNNVGIRVTGSDNEFVSNVLRRVVHPTVNAGERNRFSGNTVEP